MAKPQLKFEATIDNFDTSPFYPIIQAKPHAVVSLKDSIYLEPNEAGVEQYVGPCSNMTYTFPPPFHFLM